MRFLLAAVLLASQAVWGQSAISARSGLIHYVEGTALVNGDQTNLTAGKFYSVDQGSTFRTKEGRAEILLNPGVFLRVAHNTAIKMISSKLDDTQVEIQRGVAMMEVDELAKDNHVSVKVGDAILAPRKAGLYEIDAEAREVRVFKGSVEATLNATTLKAGEGKMLSLAPTLAESKFDKKNTDALYAWSNARAGFLAQANRDVSWSRASLYGTPGHSLSMWAWYPDLGMFTFLPGRGRIYSPFGWYFFSPTAMWQVYHPGPTINAGFNQASNGGFANSRPASSNGSTSSAAVAASTGDVGRAAPAPAPAAPSGPRGR